LGPIASPAPRLDHGTDLTSAGIPSIGGGSMAFPVEDDGIFFRRFLAEVQVHLPRNFPSE
jgi:hypothetical protein